jgi:ketosteroid isomerase-like protein
MRFVKLSLAAALVACASKPDLNAEKTAVLKADSMWLAAAQSRNVDSVVQFWTDDARVIGPAQPLISGSANIRKMVSDGFATPAFSVSWKTTDVVVGPSGDVAYSFATNQFTVPNAKGGVDTLRGNGVVVWRKEPDGRWRAAVDTWTPKAQ